MKIATFFFAVIFSFFAMNVHAQESQQTQKKVETIQIKTSAVCGMCKKTIETALYDLKGVTSANLDVSSKVVTVTYKTSKITAEEIKKAITISGYDADEIAADPAAYENLHFCCKKDVNHE